MRPFVAFCMLTGIVLAGFILSMALGPALPEVIPHQDKVGHAGAFLVLGFLFAWKASPRRLLLVALALALLAFAIEHLQARTTTDREASFADALASLAGLGAGIVLSAMASSRRRKAFSAKQKRASARV